MLPPTLLPNILLATRSALFPANARPVALGVSTGAPAFTPQPSVQLPNTDGKSLTATIQVAAASPTALAPQVVSNIPLATQSGETAGKSIVGNGTTINNSSGGGNDQLSSVISHGSAIAVDTPTDTQNPSSALPTVSDDKRDPSTAIAAIQRQCAASLLALIPRSVARILLGLPAPTSSDRTCSSTTGRSSSLTTKPGSPLPYPPKEKAGGVSSTLRSSSQRSAGTSLSGSSEEEQVKTPEVDDEELPLLHAIEADLLDLLADEYCNKHLVYAIFETVLAKILPELAERSVADLMDDRGVPPVPGF